MEKIKFSDYKNKIIETLNPKLERFKSFEPDGFYIIDGFVNIPIQTELNNTVMVGGPSIPVVVLVGISTGKFYNFALKSILPDLVFE